ncbi:hypothetical protein NC651_001988 [Populus alba x Populus x berolinensis]|nr:hypothetical protein NC651_001988 [Populus alba x Populus x berolinensis]
MVRPYIKDDVVEAKLPIKFIHGHLYRFLVFLVDDFYKSQFSYPLVIISLRCPLVSCHCDPFFFLLKEMDF